MTQVATAPNVVNLNNAVQTTPVRFWRDPIEFATFLVALKGPQLLSFDAVYPFDEMSGVVKKHRVTKLPNPFLGIGLKKYSTTQATVNFDYQSKVEKRDGEYSGKGNWSQCVVVNGLPSPISTHKDDCTVTDGVITFKENPRLYLRYEIIRSGEGETRADKDMRSKSVWRLPDGTEVDKAEIEPYLPIRNPREDNTDVQTTKLENVVELRAGGTVWRGWKAENAIAALNEAVR